MPIETFDEYQHAAHKTAKPLTPTNALTMAAMGLAGEAGEVVDELKKHVFHAKALDRVKLAAEMGDVLWYLAELATSLGIELQTVASENIAKLRARHGGEQFKIHSEQNR